MIETYARAAKGRARSGNLFVPNAVIRSRLQRSTTMLICSVLEPALFSAAAEWGFTPITIGRGSDTRIIGYALMQLEA